MHRLGGNVEGMVAAQAVVLHEASAAASGLAERVVELERIVREMGERIEALESGT
jgi:uncharacterized protein YceH (UPF0502 family)